MTHDIKKAIEEEILRLVPESSDALHGIKVEYVEKANDRLVRITNNEKRVVNAKETLKKLRDLPDKIGHDAFWEKLS